MQETFMISVALIFSFAVGSPVDSTVCTDAVADLQPQGAHALLQVHNGLRSLDTPAQDINNVRSPASLWKPSQENVAGPVCCMFEMGHVFADGKKASSSILPIDCSKRTLPIHVDSYAKGYVFRELGIETGGYRELFVVPYTRTTPPYKDLHACGINPKDSVIYCVMSVDGTWYITRVDRDIIEFTAKLKGTAALSGIISSATFGPSGNFYFVSNKEPYLVFTVPGTEALPGFDSQGASGLTDLSELDGAKFPGCKTCEDMVVAGDDLDGSGSGAEYLLTFMGNTLQVVKAEGEYKSWTIPASGAPIDNWTAGWSYSGEVFFSHAKGEGVYQIPLRMIDLNNKGIVQVKKVGEAEPCAQTDGMTCLNAGNPFHTRCNISFYHEIQPFTNGTCPKGSMLIA